MSFLDNFNHLIQRAQKITEALYRVTDLFPEEEPLKWNLRKKSMNIFSRIVELKDAPTYRKAQNLEEIIYSTSRILNFLELAAASSFISQLNFEVLKREYLSLVKFIKERKEEFLPSETTLFNIGADKQESIGHSNEMTNRLSIKDPSEKSLSNKDDNKIKKAVTFPSKKPILYNSSINKADRKKQIITILSSKDWAGIKDIVSSFQGISSKTIQRELSSMVDKGILRKAGEKRWRKYTLKKGA